MEFSPSGAVDRSCNVCNRTGHYSKSRLCPKYKETAARIPEATESDSESNESLGRILVEPVAKMATKTDTTIYAKVKVAGAQDASKETAIRMATDTGVRKTIFNRTDWEKIKNGSRMVKTHKKFRPYGTDIQLPVRGRAKVYMRAKAGALICTYVYVNDDDKETTLLGKRDAERLGIVNINLRGSREEVRQDETNGETEEVQRVKLCRKSELGEKSKPRSEQVNKRMEQLVVEFGDIFGGIGKYKGDLVKIQMKEDVPAVIQPPRRIPLHYRQPLKDHLEELLKEDVIEGPLKEEEEGTWISNLVITDKKWEGDESRTGDRVQIRANLDLRPLNKFVYQTHEPIPTPEELRHELLGSDRFSKLDMVHSFHQFELEAQARKLFAFRTPWGLYRFKRLVMGNSPASSEAHRRVKNVVAGLPGVLQIKDDVLIHGVGDQHDERLQAVLQRFREAGLTLRQEKCELGRQEVKWFGMVFGREGMTADPDKTAGIRDWPPPRTVRDVKSFLQTVQFNSVFLGAEEPGEMNYPELTAPLRELTKRGRRFTWTDKHEKHFQIIKKRLCSDKVMVPFDPARRTRCYTDGGPEGAQATVAQQYDHPGHGEQWRPVAHTARAWTEAERRYSQIEKESNALLTGIISNRTYLMGVKFEAVVDHKPLVPLYNSPGRPKQMRVDRHRMKLAGYDFEVVHMSGSQIPCDYGSRGGCPEPKEYSREEKEKYGVEDDDEIYVNRVVEEQLPIAITRQMMLEATEADSILQQLVHDIKAGQCRKSLTRYVKVFDELSVVDGLVVRGEQLVIPAVLQPTVVQLAHEGHALGHDKTLSLLRETCWFPGMGEMVRIYVETCKPCMAALPSTQQEPLRPTLLPDRAWQQVHADFKGPIGGKYYLHTFIDQFSKYPLVEVCTSTSWEKMKPQLENVTGMMGIMEILVTDGGPPYDSHSFKQYVRKMGINHHICTPENPQANGFVEVFQKVLIKMVHTAVVEKKDPREVIHQYLMAYRAAPHKTTGKSPYEMMFRRKMKTKIPQRMMRKDSAEEVVTREKHDKEKLKQKEASDKRRRSRKKEVKAGDKIMIQQKKTTVKPPWDPKEFEVTEVKGSKVKARRGEEVKERAKNRIKVVKERPEFLKIRSGKIKEEEEEELDLEVSWGRIAGMEKDEQAPVQEVQRQERINPEQAQEDEEGSQDRARVQLSPRDRRRRQAEARAKKPKHLRERWILLKGRPGDRSVS